MGQRAKKGSSKTGIAANLEIAASVCVVMGIALFVAVDTGVLKFGSKSPAPSEASFEEALERIDRTGFRAARIKALQDKVELVEGKLKEKAETFAKMNGELEDFTRRLASERKSLNTMATLVLEIEKDREGVKDALKDGAKKETGRLASIDKKSWSGGLAKIASAVRSAGVPAANLEALKWQGREYLRIARSFEFQKTGIYLVAKDMKTAEAVADAIDSVEAREIKVIYRDGEEKSRERAFVLRNFIRETLGDEFDVKVSKIAGDIVATGTVELWVGQE